MSFAEFLRYPQVNAICGPAALAAYTEPSVEERQRMNEEAANHQREYERRAVACAVIEVAEKLVTTHNMGVAVAFERAQELAEAAKNFVDTFQK